MDGTERIVEVGKVGTFLENVYRELLEPNFPPNELEAYASLASGVANASTNVMVALDDKNVPLGVVVGSQWSPHSIILLTYLAVDRRMRSAGVGGRLLEYALGQWERQAHPYAVLAEIEDPACHTNHRDYGDPARRLDFYASHGAQLLALRYIQPKVRADLDRPCNMRLIAVRHKSPVRKFDAAILRDFLNTYYLISEGSELECVVPQSMVAALREPFIALHDLASV